MTKNFLYISLAFASASMLFSCSTEDEPNIVGEQMKEMVNSDLEILLSTGNGNSSNTRASVESTPGGFFEAENLGLFMLARSTSETGTNLKIDWRGEGYEDITEHGVLYPNIWSIGGGTGGVDPIYNLQTDAVYVRVDGNVVGTEMHWHDGLARYYPMGDYHRYSFYAYHPRVEDSDITNDGTSITAHITGLDGTKDIIAGRASVNELPSTWPSKDMAYSAKFFRQDENRYDSERARPAEMDMEHKLCRLTFAVVAGGTPMDPLPTVQQDYAKALATTIKSISIVNAPSQIDLKIADRNAPETEGQITFDPVDRNTEYILKETNAAGKDRTLTPFTPKTKEEDGMTVADTVRIGQGILVPPIKSTDEPYKLQIVIEYMGYEMTLCYPMKLGLAGGISELKAGNSYEIKLTMFGPEQVAITARLRPWKENPTSSGFLVDPDLGTIPVH